MILTILYKNPLPVTVINISSPFLSTSSEYIVLTVVSVCVRTQQKLLKSCSPTRYAAASCILAISIFPGIEIIIIAFALIVMVYGGISITSLSMTQKTASLGIPMGYVYIVIPITGVVIAVYGVLNVICLIRKGEEA